MYTALFRNKNKIYSINLFYKIFRMWILMKRYLSGTDYVPDVRQYFYLFLT